MLLSEEIILPCSLRLPNRLCKVYNVQFSRWRTINNHQAAMAELMAPSHIPDQKFLKAYGEWAEGNWTMVLTGEIWRGNVSLAPSEVLLACDCIAKTGLSCR